MLIILLFGGHVSCFYLGTCQQWCYKDVWNHLAMKQILPLSFQRTVRVGKMTVAPFQASDAKIPS